jgi:oligosaccharide reducing-end xylanase
VIRRALLAAAFLLTAAAPVPPYQPPAIPYRNLFVEADPTLTQTATDAKLATYWHALFEGDEDQRVFYPAAPTADGAAAYILDTGNDDVRSEGMSYGMMIAVQMNRRAEFDQLWNWAATHMRYRTGPRAGYFRWQCTRAGCPRDAGPASDGEEYFATALFFAAHRWGNGRGLYDYEAQANAILDTMLHKQDMNGGVVDGVTNMFDRRAHQVVFVPLGPFATFTDPSYHLPAFYELWARWAKGWQGRQAADRAFWAEAARESRRLFARAAHPTTALTPDYAEFDGRPHATGGHGDFRYDAFRTAVNWSVDQAWWGADPAAAARTDRLQAFFAGQDIDRYPAEWSLDGQPLSTSRSTALIASNGVASLAATHPRGREFVPAAWALEPPRGRWRYYDGLLQMLAMLHGSGRFRAW